MDVLQASGKIDALLSSCARFAEKVSVLDSHKRGQLPPAETIKMGPPKVFGRLWEQLGIQKIVKELLGDRKYEFDVERALFLTVLHRLMVSGSDRSGVNYNFPSTTIISSLRLLHFSLELMFSRSAPHGGQDSGHHLS